jgi:LacI family transcriptional regulator
MGAMRFFKQEKIHVPSQMGLVGFSNWDMSKYASPSLSSVDQHAYQIGEKAVEILIASIKSNEVGKEEIHEIKTSLVFRESSAKRQGLF